MVTTATPTLTPAAAARSHAWLTGAAVQLEARGDLALATEARAEAAALLVPVAAPAPATMRCDSCRSVIKGAKRLADYEAIGVDWALCAGCE